MGEDHSDLPHARTVRYKSKLVHEVKEILNDIPEDILAHYTQVYVRLLDRIHLEI